MGIDMIRKWFGGKAKCFAIDFVVYEVRSGYVWWATGGFPRREKWSVGRSRMASEWSVDLTRFPGLYYLEAVVGIIKEPQIDAATSPKLVKVGLYS